jgi:hypothetical protein
LLRSIATLRDKGLIAVCVVREGHAAGDRVEEITIFVGRNLVGIVGRIDGNENPSVADGGPHFAAWNKTISTIFQDLSFVLKINVVSFDIFLKANAIPRKQFIQKFQNIYRTRKTPKCL